VDERPKGKPIDWVGFSRDDLQSFPDEVQQALGFDLYQVPVGAMPASATPLTGNVRGVHELKERHEGNAYRAVSIAKLKDTISVLHWCLAQRQLLHLRDLEALMHGFQKKSKSGIATPQHDRGLIEKRVKLAIEDSTGAQT